MPNSDCPEFEKLEELTKKLMDEDPVRRPTIEQALEIITMIKSNGNEVIDL